MPYLLVESEVFTGQGMGKQTGVDIKGRCCGKEPQRSHKVNWVNFQVSISMIKSQRILGDQPRANQIVLPGSDL